MYLHINQTLTIKNSFSSPVLIRDAGCRLDLFVFWGRLGSWSPTSPLGPRLLHGKSAGKIRRGRCILNLFKMHGWNICIDYIIVFSQIWKKHFQRTLTIDCNHISQSMVSSLTFIMIAPIFKNPRNYLTQKSSNTSSSTRSTPVTNTYQHLDSPVTWLLQLTTWSWPPKVPEFPLLSTGICAPTSDLRSIIWSTARVERSKVFSQSNAFF